MERVTEPEAQWAADAACLFIERYLKGRRLWGRVPFDVVEMLTDAYTNGWLDAKADGEIMRERM